MDGCIYRECQYRHLLYRTQDPERQKGTLYGVALITIGIAGSSLLGAVGGADMQVFITGILLGLYVAEILAGVRIIGKQILCR